MNVTTTMCPRGMRRLGIVMEPDPSDPREAGGVLNPAVARGPDGQLYLLPRLVAAGNYSRLGLVRFAPHQDIDLAGQENKDAVLFPEPVRAPDGRPALALIHRPTFPAAFAERVRLLHVPREQGLHRPSMWISYAPVDEIVA